MGLLSKAAILAAGLHKELIDVKEFGGAVYVRRITGKQREEFVGAARIAKDTKEFMVVERLLVSMCVCDEHGALMFSPADLETLDAKAVEFLSDHAQRINSLGSHREQAAKNSESTQSAAPGSN